MKHPASFLLAGFCAVAAAATASETKPDSPPVLNGLITGVEENGRILNIKSRDGEQRVVKLPAGVRVIRAIDFSKVKKGDRIFAVLGDVDGETLMRRGIVNGERPEKNKAGPESGRVWGEVAEVDVAARLLKIKTDGGKIRSVGVAQRVRINAFTGVGDLRQGDSVVLVAQGPFDPDKVRTVIVNSGCPGRF